MSRVLPYGSRLTGLVWSPHLWVLLGLLSRPFCLVLTPRLITYEKIHVFMCGDDLILKRSFFLSNLNVKLIKRTFLSFHLFIRFPFLIKVIQYVLREGKSRIVSGKDSFYLSSITRGKR